MTQLPYLPKGREIKYVSINHPFMIEAEKARRELAGDSLYPVGVVLIKEGEVKCRAGNGYSLGAKNQHICPRVVEECQSGQGYDLCHFHDGSGHAEQMLIKIAQKQGIETQGADIYLYGHWWCCQSCWQVMIEAGISNVYLVERADEIFHRDQVYAKTLKIKIKNILFGGENLNQDFFNRLISFSQSLSLKCVVLNSKISLSEELLNLIKTKEDLSDVWILILNDLNQDYSLIFKKAVEKNKKIIILSKKDRESFKQKLDFISIVYYLKYQDEIEIIHKLPLILKQL